MLSATTFPDRIFSYSSNQGCSKNMIISLIIIVFSVNDFAFIVLFIVLSDVSCTAWFRTTLFGVVIHMCRRHAAPTQAQVRLHRTAWRSDLSSVNYWRSCLSCCWSKGVEWPAKQSYLGLVAVGVQEQAEDILLPPLLRNCLTFSYVPLS